jgi:hypothetical protein
MSSSTGLQRSAAIGWSNLFARPIHRTLQQLHEQCAVQLMTSAERISRIRICMHACIYHTHANVTSAGLGTWYEVQFRLRVYSCL